LTNFPNSTVLNSLEEREQFLCLVLTHVDHLNCESIVNIYKNLGSDKLFALCKHNKIESIAAEALIRCLGKENVENIWLDAYAHTYKKIHSFMSELERIGDIFSKNDIKLVPLKNSGITLSLYPHYGSCPMGDLDVLVNYEDFDKAHDLLISEGYKLKFRSSLESNDIKEAKKSGGAEYFIKLNGEYDLWFELQWRSVAGRWIREGQEPKADFLINNSVRYKNTGLYTLCPEHNLIQVCLHTAKHSYIRAPGFRLNTDVDRIVRNSEIDWINFQNLVEELEIRTACFFSLFFAKELLKTPIPENIIIKNYPGKWKFKLILNWLVRLNLFDPDGKKWSKIGFIFFVALLYDSPKGIFLSVFPSFEWMKKKYNIKSKSLLPYYYIVRLLDLSFKRSLNK